MKLTKKKRRVIVRIQLLQLLLSNYSQNEGHIPTDDTLEHVRLYSRTPIGFSITKAFRLLKRPSATWKGKAKNRCFKDSKIWSESKRIFERLTKQSKICEHFAISFLLSGSLSDIFQNRGVNFTKPLVQIANALAHGNKQKRCHSVSPTKLRQTL